MPDLLERLSNGDPRALARAITLVENRAPGSAALLKAAFPRAGRARVIGVTGSPGSGKSTLVDGLAVLYGERGADVAVVAVDPSSPFTGGAILGDRIRMRAADGARRTFIRSMATRGRLGGLAPATADVATILDAGGRDPILIETVGVGQDEIDIVRLAEISIVVLTPGMGDDVQALKAGIMEIADIFVINKCDLPGVERLERALYGMLELAAPSPGGPPRVVKTVAAEGRGLEDLADAIEACRAALDGEARADRRRRAARERLLALLAERLLEAARENVFSAEEIDRAVEALMRRETSPHEVVEEILNRVRFGRP